MPWKTSKTLKYDLMITVFRRTAGISRKIQSLKRLYKKPLLRIFALKLVISDQVIRYTIESQIAAEDKKNHGYGRRDYASTTQQP